MRTDPSALCADLATALARDAPQWRGDALEPLDDRGLAHTHVRILGRGALARIPKQSQLDLPADTNLSYQAACFTRAAASGHTPGLFAMLPPSVELPRGALIVEEIVGHTARLPNDLNAIVEALAGIHRLPMPPAAARGPLLDASDPLAALLDEILSQFTHLGAAQLEEGVAQAISAELDRLRALCAQPARPPRGLISFDAHPGNFIVRPDGRAVLVDLEKCRYSHASLDLAHATLYTSTTWDAASHAVLTLEQVVRAYGEWARCVGPLAATAAPWHLPLRRVMWLWSITWCAKWRVLSVAAASASTGGEDWSAERSSDALVSHVRERVDHFLSPACIGLVRDEFDALAAALPSMPA